MRGSNQAQLTMLVVLALASTVQVGANTTESEPMSLIAFTEENPQTLEHHCERMCSRYLIARIGGSGRIEGVTFQYEGEPGAIIRQNVKHSALAVKIRNTFLIPAVHVGKEECVLYISEDEYNLAEECLPPPRR